MTSKRKVRANQKNARSSTGPRSASGKSRASQNARQHGLSLSAVDEGEHSPAISAWAQSIAGDRQSVELRYLVGRVAAAQVDLMRVRPCPSHFADQVAV